jgi:hypothetical protein
MRTAVCPNFESVFVLGQEGAPVSSTPTVTDSRQKPTNKITPAYREYPIIAIKSYKTNGCLVRFGEPEIETGRYRCPPPNGKGGDGSKKAGGEVLPDVNPFHLREVAS